MKPSSKSASKPSAARRLKGVADNLQALTIERCQAFAGAESREDVPLADAMALLVREKLGAPIPPSGKNDVELLAILA